jgi:hypothetical protein
VYAKLNPWKLGLAAGIIWGFTLFLVTWLSMYTGWGMFWLSQWMDIYTGFDISIKGAFIGLAYGFADAFVCIFLIAWLYNLMKP